MFKTTSIGFAGGITAIGSALFTQNDMAQFEAIVRIITMLIGAIVALLTAYLAWRQANKPRPILCPYEPDARPSNCLLNKVTPKEKV